MKRERTIRVHPVKNALFSDILTIPLVFISHAGVIMHCERCLEHFVDSVTK
jgi:hypothetical protein